MPLTLTTDRRTRFSDELRVIPAWAMVLAVVGFGAAQYLMNVVVARQSDAPPLWGRVLLGILLGLVVACYLLLLGYVNRDARRRGMSPLLWTAVAVLIPNGFGLLLYFILRQPIVSHCPKCSAAVQGGFNYCPACSTRLHPSCPHCNREVHIADIYCPYCGGAISSAPSPTTGAKA